MDPRTKVRRRETRDEKIYNAIIDAEQEIWNRGAPIRARNCVPLGESRLTRWLWRKWHAGGDVVHLELNPEHVGDTVVGSYADIEIPQCECDRELSRRERFKVLTEPITRRGGAVFCKAQRIQAPDYAATQNMRLVRLLVIFALIQAAILLHQAAC